MNSFARTGEPSLAVFYLARGADPDCLARFGRFLDSYCRYPAGVRHDLFVIFKGFDDQALLDSARELFSRVAHTAAHTDDDNFDLGAYHAVCRQISHDLVCLLNTNSEIVSDLWLAKLLTAYRQPGVAMAGATGSFESLFIMNLGFPRFPNVHLRSNALILSRDFALEGLPARVPDKLAAFMSESGPSSLTRRAFERGQTVLIVGRDGRAFGPQWWPSSETFRQGDQGNLLVHDNVTRMYVDSDFTERRRLSQLTWGDLRQTSTFLLLPDRIRSPAKTH